MCVPSALSRVPGAAVLGAFLTLVLCAVGASQEYIVDQACDSFGSGGLYSNIWAYGPVGQEFVPALDHLDVAEFWTKDFDSGPAPPAGTTLQVVVHQGTIFTPALAESSPLFVPDGQDGPVEFLFSPSVPLVPGETYVLELVNLGPTNWSIHSWGGGTTGPCLGTQFIAQGEIWANSDAWFREGVWSVSAVGPYTWGTLKALYR